MIFETQIYDTQQDLVGCCFRWKKGLFFLLLLVAIDNTNLNFKLLRKRPVSKINVHCAKMYLQFYKTSVSYSDL